MTCNSVLCHARAGEIKGANQPRRVRLLALNHDWARDLLRGTGDILVDSAAARLNFLR